MPDDVDTVRDMFVHDLQTIYYIEQELVDTLDELSDMTEESDLAAAFNDHRQETRDQVERLEAVFDAIGEEPEPQGSVVFDALQEEHDQFMEQAANDDIRDLYHLGAGIKVERIEITAYENLLMLARKLDLGNNVTDQLQANLDEEEDARDTLRTMAQGSTVKSVLSRLMP